jgi:hypothetical protein
MTRALALPAKQVTALCKGAAKAGYIPEITIGSVTVRLVPEEKATSKGSIDERVNGYL